MVKTKLATFIYILILTGFTAFTVLEAFVIPQAYAVVDTGSQLAQAQQTEPLDAEAESGGATGAAGENSGADGSESGSAETVSTATSYQSDGVEITLTTYREYDTDIYVADVLLDSGDSLQTAFAQNIYGKNVTAPTSETAEENDAILAINGDYYSARDGYVIRNGVIYSDSSSDSDQEDLVIYEDGSMEVIREGDISCQELLDKGAVQVFCFGPGLVEDGQVAVADGEEISGKSMASNPRTAIGWISDNHYVFVVSDGRTDASAGLDLDELATFLQKLGCRTAYNLDGGGSSTMYFNGNVINNPTGGGRHSGERSVSDIVYIKR